MGEILDAAAIHRISEEYEEKRMKHAAYRQTARELRDIIDPTASIDEIQMQFLEMLLALKAHW